MSYVTAMKGTAPFILLSYIIPDWDLIPLKDITNEESYEDSNEGQQDDTSSDNFVNYGSSDVNTVENVSENGDLNEDNFDADSFLDSLLEEYGIEEASNNIDEQQEQQEETDEDGEA